ILCHIDVDERAWNSLRAVADVPKDYAVCVVLKDGRPAEYLGVSIEIDTVPPGVRITVPYDDERVHHRRSGPRVNVPEEEAALINPLAVILNPHFLEEADLADRRGGILHLIRRIAFVPVILETEERIGIDPQRGARMETE